VTERETALIGGILVRECNKVIVTQVIYQTGQVDSCNAGNFYWEFSEVLTRYDGNSPESEEK
jgi:hypothetical protein